MALADSHAHFDLAGLLCSYVRPHVYRLAIREVQIATLLLLAHTA